MSIQRFFAVFALLAAGIAATTLSVTGVLAGDPVICFQREVNKVIPAGETYRMKSSKEVILGLGDNTIYGSSGNDEICFAEGSDNNVAYGGTGNDVIIIEGGNSVAHGGTGDDIILGYDGASAYGDGGNDSLDVGGDRANEIRVKIVDGGSGNDGILYDYVEKVAGGGGSDGIVGFDALVVEAGSGNDVLNIGSLEPDRVTDVNCGSGRDNLTGTELGNVVSCELGKH